MFVGGFLTCLICNIICEKIIRLFKLIIINMKISLQRIVGDNKPYLYLQRDGWNDWFEFQTLYYVSYVNEYHFEDALGSIKIGQTSMDKASPLLEVSSNGFTENFFSVGQDVSYYEKVESLGEDLRILILSSLNDIAYDEDAFAIALKERVTRISLLREVSLTSITGQFRRLAQGNAELSKYNFNYKAYEKNILGESLDLKFYVDPYIEPSSNIHVIIGTNGVGKTYLLNNMVNSLLNPDSIKYGSFKNDTEKKIFANLIYISFSAFDRTEPLAEKKDKVKSISYSYLGLKRGIIDGKKNYAPKSPTILKNEFIKSVENCMRGVKNDRWRKCLKILESDIVFRDKEIAKIADITDDNFDEKKLGVLFNGLSSGHKIILLTLTKLVEKLEEKSLVIIDEPETHLHPPLLSSFIIALSNLLRRTNAVSIIATHSPVVLQEVPKRCIYKLSRFGEISKAERIQSESFGENVSVLTREIFGLEVDNSGFHNLLKDRIETEPSITFEEVNRLFNGELGSEAKAMIFNLIK